MEISERNKLYYIGFIFSALIIIVYNVSVTFFVATLPKMPTFDSDNFGELASWSLIVVGTDGYADYLLIGIFIAIIGILLLFKSWGNRYLTSDSYEIDHWMVIGMLTVTLLLIWFGVVFITPILIAAIIVTVVAIFSHSVTAS